MPVETIDKGLAAVCSLGRVGVPQDIGRVVSFLAGPESEWINGKLHSLNECIQMVTSYRSNSPTERWWKVIRFEMILYGWQSFFGLLL
jgi:hypothetical protein